jgi:hypothetical protein
MCVFFYFIINQQSECTFYKLRLLPCLDEESSSGEVQFLLSRLLSSLADSALMSVFSWVTVLVWCLLLFCLMAS